MARNHAKSRLIRCAALAPVALTSVFLTASAHGQGARADAVYSVRGRITILAADGNRAAVTTQVKPGCGRVVVWTAPGNEVDPTSSRGSSAAQATASPGSRSAAGRVAWIEQGGGNDLEMTVMEAKLSGGAGKQLEFVTNGDRAGGDPTGDWVGRLLGSGSLLAYNSWTQTCDRRGDQECGQNDPFLRLTNEKLVRITDGRRLVITRGAAAYPLTAVGGGRMAVGTAGAVSIRAANGAQVATVPDPAGDRSRGRAEHDALGDRENAHARSL